tara:strand:- start:387 stop:1361 length:975 start_codon:yes stop_codon:yes gene_type:complete
MRIDISGNVGIGTTTVGQFDSTNVGLTVDSGNAYSGIAITDGATTSTLAQGYSTTYLYNQANGSMSFGTNNTERMRIDSSGNLLLGRGASAASGSEATRIQFYNANSTYDIASIRSEVGAGQVNRGELVFAVNNGAVQQERMRIDFSGNVGIGTSGPFSALHVKKVADLSLTSNQSQMRIEGNGYTGFLGLDASSFQIGQNSSARGLSFHSGTGMPERMRIDSSGSLLVGTTARAYTEKVSVSGTSGNQGMAIRQTDNANANDKILFVNTNGIVGYIRTTGSTTSYNTSSDQRLKENIADAGDAGSRIDAIQVRQYDWKADGSH